MPPSHGLGAPRTRRYSPPGRAQVPQQLAMLRSRLTCPSLESAGPLHSAATLPTHQWERDPGLQLGPCLGLPPPPHELYIWEGQAQWETWALRAMLFQGRDAQHQVPSLFQALGCCLQPSSASPPSKWVWKDGAPLPEEGSPNLVGGGWSKEGMEWGSRAGRAWRQRAWPRQALEGKPELQHGFETSHPHPTLLGRSPPPTVPSHRPASLSPSPRSRVCPQGSTLGVPH